MEPIRDWEACQRLLATVPRTRSYSSNLYAAPEQVEHWCIEGRLYALIGNGSTLLLRRDRDFFHIYHAAVDQGALRTALASLETGPFTADLIGQGAPLDAVCATYAAAGFSPYQVLQRLSRTQSPTVASDGEADVAAPGDAPRIAAFLDRLLDRFSEQVPEVDELRREAEAGRLLIVRRGEAVAGMLLYDLKGRMAHLRFWHVDANARGEGVGRRLITAFLARCAQAQRVLLWVVADNARSIAIYRHYGFTPDGLLDRIMIRRKERHQ